MEAFLIREGYNVQATTNAQEAIRFTKNLSPDLAILDVMMPGMNGYDLCKSLKSLSGRKFFPIILLTGLDQLENKITGIEAGADDFLANPSTVSNSQQRFVPSSNLKDYKMNLIIQKT